MQNFIFILSPFIFATACLAASEGVEYLKNLKLDCVRITGVEKIEAGNKIDGAKAATAAMNDTIFFMFIGGFSFFWGN